MAAILSKFDIGVALGVFIGGIISVSTSWHWAFYMSLPIGSVLFRIKFLLLRVSYEDDRSSIGKIRCMDFLGDAILMVVSTHSAMLGRSTHVHHGIHFFLCPLVL
jgi:MFS family permease